MSEVIPIEAQETKRGVLLTVISLFLGFGSITSMVMVTSEIAASFGLVYQVSLVVSSMITGAASVGIWKARKWGAYVYITLSIVNQPYLLLMGWWNIGALVIPGVIAVLLAIKLRSMK